MRKFYFTLLFSLSTVLGFAQSGSSGHPGSGAVPHRRTCGTMTHDSLMQVQLKALIPGYQPNQPLTRQIQQLPGHPAAGSTGKAAAAVYNIPVVVHIIHNGEAVGSGMNISAAQVQSQIAALNEDYRNLNADGSLTPTAFQSARADVEFNFCLAIINPSGGVMAEAGIDRINRNTAGFTAAPYTQTYMDNTIKPATSWNPSNYLNLWVTDIGTSLLGWAQFPDNTAGLGGLNTLGGTANKDGVVINYTAFGRTGTATAPYNKGRTATHEVGHWLGLRHIWGDAVCGTDYVTDTPQQRDENYGCPTYPATSNGSCNGTNGDMFMNYMDYTDDACMFMFTTGQKARMQAVMAANTPRRTSLASSTVCNSPIAPTAAFTASLTSITAGCSITFTDQSTGGPTSWSWNFGGGVSPNTSTTQSPTVTFNTPGIYTITLTATNAIGANTLIKTSYITVKSLACTDTLTNFTGTNALYKVSAPQKGYVAGHNSYLDKAKAEKFAFCGPASKLNRLIYYFGMKKGTGNITATVWNANGTGGAPGTVLFSQAVAISSLAAAGSATVLNLATPISISGDFYIGFQMTYAAGDTVALLTNTIAQAGSNNTAWEQQSNSAWASYTASWGISLNHRIYAGFDNRPTVAVTPASSSKCGGATTSLTASGGSTYAWSPATALSATTGATVTATPAATVTYTVTGTATNGCTNKATAVITVTPAAAVSVSPAAPGICAGASAALTASGHTSYAWSPATALSATTGATVTATPAATTTYTVTGTTGSCSASATVIVTVTPKPVVSVSPATAAICAGSSAALTASGAAAYAWSPVTGLSNAAAAIVTASPAATVTYTITGTSNGCSGTATAVVSVNAAPVASASSNSPVCAGTALSLSASGGTSYTWSGPNGFTSFSANPSVPNAGAGLSGSYSVIVKNGQGCTTTTSTQVSVTTAATWTGAVSSAWTDAQNWNGCMPTQALDVVIPSGLSRYPVISTGTAVMKGLSLQGALTLSGGQLQLYGDFTRTGTLSHTGGTFEVRGAVEQQLAGAPFHTLLVAGTGNKTLTGNASVQQQLTMSSGTLETGANTVTLAAAATLAETGTSYITGRVSTSRTVGTSLETFGGIGLSLTPAVAPGLTTVTRVTGDAQTGVNSSVSVTRYYDISAPVNTGLNATMTMRYLHHELNGISEADLTMFKSNDAGQFWVMKGFTTRDSVANTVTLNGVDGFSRWTLGSLANPLPVELLWFTAERQDKDALLQWETASEAANAGFSLEVSTDGSEYTQLAQVKAQHTATTQRQRYTYTDRSTGKSGTRYYRLWQHDLDGSRHNLGTRSVAFEGAAASLLVAPNPFAAAFTAHITLDAASEATVTVTDVLGRVLLRQTRELTAGQTTLPFELAGLQAGVYHFTLQAGDQVLHARMLKQ